MAEENGWLVEQALISALEAWDADSESPQAAMTESLSAAVEVSGGALGPRVEEYRAVIADLIADEPESEEGSPRWYAFRNARALLAGTPVQGPKVEEMERAIMAAGALSSVVFAEVIPALVQVIDATDSNRLRETVSKLIEARTDFERQRRPLQPRARRDAALAASSVQGEG